MTLKSEFRWNEKLRNCALYDHDHISKIHAPIGDWAELIHKALNAWGKKITRQTASLLSALRKCF